MLRFFVRAAKKAYFCLPKIKKRAIRRLSYIVRLVVGIVVSGYLGVLLFTALPACQQWLAVKVSGVLSRELHTEVHVGNVRLGLFNRVVLDDVLLLDREADTLLSATRLSVKFSPMELMEGRVRLSSAQLFGYDIRLRRPSPEDPYNFQFIVDYFASEDTTSTPLDLHVSQLLVRRGSLSHDVLSEPPSGRFALSHMRLGDLNLRLSIDTLTNERISANVSKLSFVESRSGLTLKDLSLHASATLLPDGSYAAALQELRLRLPSSELHVPAASAIPGRAQADIDGYLSPADLAPLVPLLRHFPDSFQLSAHGEWADSLLSIRALRVEGPNLAVDADVLSLPLRGFADAASVDLRQLHLGAPLQARVLQVLEAAGVVQRSLTELLSRTGTIDVEGHGSYHPAEATVDVRVCTDIGEASVAGTLTGADTFALHATATDLRLADLLSADGAFPLRRVTLHADARGSRSGQHISGTLSAPRLTVQGTEVEHLEATFDLHPRQVEARLLLADPRYAFDLHTRMLCDQPLKLEAATLDQLRGEALLTGLRLHTDTLDYALNRLLLTLDNQADGGHAVAINGDFIEAEARGRFSYLTLGSTLQGMLHRTLPSLVPAPAAAAGQAPDQMDFALHLWNTNPLLAMAHLPVQLPEAGYVQGRLDAPHSRFSLQADCPHLLYGSQDLRAVSLIAHAAQDSIGGYLTLQRMMDSGPVDISLTAGGAADEVTSVVAWDDHNQPAQRGELSARARFSRDEDARLGADLTFLPTRIVVADTVWNVHPSEVSLRGGVADVRGFRISQAGRHLHIDGRVSPQPTDTLYADLRHINLQYVFGIIDFHDVEFAGLATGKVKVHHLFDAPAVDARLRVDDFAINDGLLGQLHLNGGFGRKDDRAIDLDGRITDPASGRLTNVVGLIKPGREAGRGMDLRIYANHINTYFINHFTSSFMTDLQGYATGYAHLYGPFGRLDLEGDLALDTLAVTIDVLGTRYHLLGGDSIHLRPGSIAFRDVHLYDHLHGTDHRRHEGVLRGAVRFEHFKNIRYDFDITAHDLLGYDFRDFGDQTFYGTVFADGAVRLAGQPGQLRVDLQCTPTAGTVFTYNASSPETLTDNEFITFRATQGEPPPIPSPGRGVQTGGGQAETSSPPQGGDGGGLSDGSGGPDDLEGASDIHINFDLDISPVAQMRLLMDPRSEDYITLFGSGHIRATYHNKGRFQMYGTYRVARGTYKLSLQDVIRKDFQFEQGSTITFGGAPMKGDLNLRAIYTVPSVSLNDLAVGNNFSASSVRVNCIMNIGGQAEHPQVSFDFDIPNVNEDEKQMVRSLISTEEERNLQVIYLLGIGRFYTYGLSADESQTSTAMQSLLSSTLSGQLNDILSNAIGSSNWNFGTNLSTGQLGWQDMDVEGMLSGRLLNNRLLINGTFGYHDTPVANTNFIGDFDVQWLLTPSGTVSLKAYSETNDRYFTKTALTTQGIGIQLKKDFNSLRDLFRKR